MAEKKLIFIENTNPIWITNFSGDPSRDRFGSNARKVSLIIPTHEQARELIDEGFNVRMTKPREGEEEDFVPTYFVSVNINYDSKWPPKIYLVSGNSEPVLLDEDTVDELDHCRIKNINAVLNPYNNPNTHRTSLYVQTMYVEQDLESDPFASRYARFDRESPTYGTDEELPF